MLTLQELKEKKEVTEEVQEAAKEAAKENGNGEAPANGTVCEGEFPRGFCPI